MTASLFQTFSDSLRLFLIPRFVEQCEHVLLIIFYTGLVERINPQHQSTDSARLLEEIEELPDVIFIDLGHFNPHVRHSSIDMRQPRAEFCHLIHFIDTLSGYIVKPIEVLLVRRDTQLMIDICH